jgi:predicted phosphodiesterase
MSGAKLQGEIIKKYLEKHPMMPSLTIAKLIYNENPKVYRNVENVRKLIRYYRGRNGKKSRSNLATRDFLLPAPTKENPYSLPEFDTTNYTPYHVPAELRRGLIIADLHVPYTCKSALEIAIADAVKFGIDFIIILGDFLDCYHLSRFEKDPRVRQFRSEIDIGKHLLCVLRKQFPEAHIILKEGNHDRRYEDYLLTHAPQLIGFEEYRLSVLLDCFNLGVDWVGDKRVIYSGKLNCIHGDEYWKAVSSPANPARTAFLRSKASTLMAHHHQSSEHTESDIRGDIITCWSLGCLCDLHPHYMPLNKWNLGYALTEKDSQGNFHVDNKRIWQGKPL